MPATDCPKCGGCNTCEIVYVPVASQKEYDILVAHYKYGIWLPPVVQPVDREMHDCLAACSGDGLRFPLTVPPEYRDDDPLPPSWNDFNLSSIVRLVDREKHDRLVAQGRIHLGGSGVSPTSPALYCNDCQKKWGLYCPKCGSSDTCQIVYRPDAGAKDSKPPPYVVLEPGPITYGSPADEAEYDRLVAEKKIRPGRFSPSSFFRRPASTSMAEEKFAWPEKTADPARHCNGCGNEWNPYCPNCRSADLCRTIHGHVLIDGDAEKLMAKKKISLDGCCGMGIIPDWECNRCNTRWYDGEKDDGSD